MLRKKVRDILVPLEKYSVVNPEDTLRTAVSSLRRSYCRMETGMCAETGPRTVLVVDHHGELMGIVDFRTILAVLIPEVAGGLSSKFEALGVSLTFAEYGYDSPDRVMDGFEHRVRKNSEVKIKDIMLKSRASIQADADLVEALKLIFRKKIKKLPVYDKEKLIGVVRDADLFLAVADVLVGSS